MSPGWRLALRNLSRNYRRNFATGVAIALGFAALLALGGYINRVEKYLRIYTIYGARIGHVMIYKKDGLEKFTIKPKVYSFTPEEQNVIKDVLSVYPGVELHGGQLTGQGLVGNGCRTFPFMALGIDPEIERAVRLHPLVARWTPKIKNFNKGRGIWEYPEEIGAVAVAEGLARILRKSNVYDDFPPDHKPVLIADCVVDNVADLIASDSNVQLAGGTWDGMMTALDGEIVSSYRTGVTETNNSAIITSLTHLQKLYETKNVTYYSIWLDNADNTAAAAADLKVALGKKGLDVDIYTWLDEAVAPFYSGIMSFLRTMVGFITFILASVVILSIFNASTMTVIERSQEIGMMRALGYTRADIRQLFVREVLLLTIVSTFAGTVLGIVGILFVNSLNVQFTPPGIAGAITLILQPNTETIVGALLLVFVLSVFTTLFAVKNMVGRNITLLLMGSNR